MARIRMLAAAAVIGAAAGCSASHLNPVPTAAQPYYQPTRTLQVVHGHLRPDILRAAVVGSLPPQQKLHLAIGLPLRDGAGLRALLDGISNRPSNGNRRYLSPAEFQDRFSPSSHDYESVIAFARATGLTVTQTYPGRVVIDVEATVAAIQRAFHITMQTRRRPDGTLFYAPSREPALALQTPILYIAGLDNEQVPRPTLSSTLPVRPGGGRMRPNAGSGPGGLFAGSDFRNAYATNAPQTGAGQCVGLLEFDSSFFPSDIAAYQAEFKLPPLSPQAILLDGYNGQPVIGTGEQETALDIEVVQAMAPGVNNILVYEGSLTDSIFAAMTSGQLCSQLSASWTFGVDPTSQELVDQMVLQGQSFFVSSGDGGGFTKDTKDDRDLSNTVVVGGTELTLNADFRWQSETAWPGSGGGPREESIHAAVSARPQDRSRQDAALAPAPGRRHGRVQHVPDRGPGQKLFS